MIEAKWTIEFFNLKFEECLRAGMTHQDAYGKVEEDHYKLFKCTRYAYYDSFRQSRRGLIRKKRI